MNLFHPICNILLMDGYSTAALLKVHGMQAEKTMSMKLNCVSTEPSDEILLRQASHGQKEAFSVIYERYGKRMYAYALRLTGSSVQADDILQESMIAVWKGAAAYRGEGSALAWLLSIVRNKTLLTFRGRLMDSIEEDELDIPDDSPHLETSLSEDDRRVRVRTALKHLSPEHREVLELVFYQGLDQKEIAQVCGCPVGTVKSRLSYARNQLRGILSREGFDPKDEL